MADYKLEGILARPNLLKNVVMCDCVENIVLQNKVCKFGIIYIILLYYVLKLLLLLAQK